METVFVRVDRIEAARAGFWYGWAVFQRGSEEFAAPFKFRFEPTVGELEAEALAYAVSLNKLAAAE